MFCCVRMCSLSLSFSRRHRSIPLRPSRVFHQLFFDISSSDMEMTAKTFRRGNRKTFSSCCHDARLSARGLSSRLARRNSRRSGCSRPKIVRIPQRLTANVTAVPDKTTESPRHLYATVRILFIQNACLRKRLLRSTDIQKVMEMYETQHAQVMLNVRVSWNDREDPFSGLSGTCKVRRC